MRGMTKNFAKKPKTSLIKTRRADQWEFSGNHSGKLGIGRPDMATHLGSTISRLSLGAPAFRKCHHSREVDLEPGSKPGANRQGFESLTGFSKGGTNPLTFQIDVKALAA